MKKILLTLVWCLAFAGVALAQRTVVGTIIGDDGEPLIGATVRVKGSNAGTVSDINGKYSIGVPASGTALVISYTGFETQEIALGASNVVDVTMKTGRSLDEVVVTALGIKRDKKALGYAATQVSSQEIAEKPETDVARALIGRSPGLNILNSSGLAGSGTKINIRGTSTISGNSQPMWVVDGVPINVDANENNNFREGNVTPTRNLDLDPNNIESISILRGLSATTLYGSQGRNGVILVTTKTGSANKKRYSASVSQSLHFVEAFIPEYQNKWANGFDGNYGEFFSNWGYVMDGRAPRNPANNLWFRHPYWEHRNTFPQFTEFGNIDGSTEAKGYIPVAQPNNVKDFFQTGNSRTTSVQAGVSSEAGSFNVSFSRTGEEGYIENNTLSRNNFSLGGVANISKKLSFNGTFSIVKTDFKTPPVGAGLGSNSAGGPSVFANLFYVPRNIDLMNWPYQNPNTGASVFYRNGNDITNPRWLLYNARQASFTDRYMSNLSVNYSILDWIKLTYRIGIDTYNENQEYYVNRGASGFPATPLNFTPFATGLLRTTAGRNTIYDHTFLVNFNRQFGANWDLVANVGLNGRQDDYIQSGMESTNQVVFNLINHRNFTANNSRTLLEDDLNYSERQIWLGSYADVTLGYKNFLYINLQGRNDWSSAHEKENASLFYPGGSIAFIPTDAFSGLSSNILNFLKLRVGYGTSANFAPPYSTRAYLTLNSNFTSDANGQVIALSRPELLPNPDLKPELLTEVEGGLEARMFNNRLGIDFSVYDRTSSDQIVERQLDPSSGFNSTFINAGTISNKGIELGLSVTPLKLKDLTWTLRANFTRNISKVEELPEGSKQILIPGGGFTNLGAFAIEGQPFSVIQGTYAVRNGTDGRTGDYLITSNGDYKISSEIAVIADPNPEFLLSGFSDLSWKGFTLSGQVDYVHGGEIFSYSAATLIGRGVAKELEDFNPTLPIILPGVLEETGQPNNIPQPASGVFFGNTIIGGGPDDRGVYDGTRLRLRELSLSYNLPKRFFGNSVVQGVTLTAIGNNLWFRAFNTPKYSKVDVDRTAFGAGNAYGIDFLGGPSAKRYGLNLRVNF